VAKNGLAAGLTRAPLVLPKVVDPLISREPLATSQSCTGEFAVLTISLRPSGKRHADDLFF